MGLFFGTDGLRGIVNDDISYEIAYKCGNSLGLKYPNSKIIIGRDTRGTGSYLTSAFSCGAMSAGLNITDVGICPTAGISYLVQTLNYDFGVVISASHNPANFNGIKIFDKTGKKLGDIKEEELEKNFFKNHIVNHEKIGTYKYNENLVKKYQIFLENSIQNSLASKKIILDCANGASYKIAPKVFKNKGAKIIAIGNNPNGQNINENCGSLHIENLIKEVINNNADMGFAYDGDSDRLIAIDEKGNIIDGDKIIYLFSIYYKEKNMLKSNTVVGTRHTNMGIEKALQKEGISLIRTDIGDKYVIAKLIEQDLLVGGEQVGHVILKDKLITGDGILNSLLIASICAEKNKNLSEFYNFDVFHQCNINVKVKDKIRIINNETLANEIEKEEAKLLNNGRIMVRVSGTEPCIRIMAETNDKDLSFEIANKIKKVIEEINNNY